MDKLEQPKESKKITIPKLSSEDLNKYCNITIAKDLKTKIDSMEEFIKGRRSLKSCFYGKNKLYGYLLPSIFCSFKDIFLDEKKGKLILDEDLNGIDIDKIKLIQTPKNLSRQNLFKEIRDAIEHKRMYPWRGKLLIKNPANKTNHKYDFEAEIPQDILMDFIITVTEKKRGMIIYQYRYNDESITRDVTLDYEKEKENIKFYEQRTTKKIIPNEENSCREYIEEMIKSVEQREINLTTAQKDIISEYFKKNKCNSGNLSYVSNHILRHDIGDRDMLLRSNILENKKYEKYKLNDFLENNDIRKFLSNGHIDPTMLFENETLIELYEKLRTTYDKNGHHISEHYRGCIKLCFNYLKSKGYSFNFNGYTFKNGNKIITFNEIGFLMDTLMRDNINIKNGILEFPNRLRVQMLKTIYINGLIKGPDPEEDRHIRNSLTHNKYTILQGIDRIILRDGYDKKNNRYSREKVYDLKDFSDTTYQEMTDQNNVNSTTEHNINAEIFLTLATKEEKENLVII